MTRVLHVAQPVDGGVGRYVADLSAAQHRDGLDVVVCSPAGPLSRAVMGSGVDWVCWPATRAPGVGLSREVTVLKEALGRVRPDVVHLHSSKAGLAGRLAARARWPTIFQPHGWPWQASGPAARLSVLWERWAVRWSAVVVCVSQAECDAGRAHGVSATYRIVVNGVDLDRFVPADEPGRHRARNALGLPPDAPVALCVGRLDAQKGQEDLVRAWPTVRSTVAGATLALVGDGPGRRLLAELVESLGLSEAVVLAGHRDDVEDWYAASDAVVLSSRWGEAMALTPLEAMASGRPVVATDVAGVRESVAAECGQIVPPGQPSALAAALADLLSDPDRARQQGRAARDHATRHLDVHASQKTLTDLVRELAAGR